MKTATTTLEESFWSSGHLVAGVDEVGRGALAGPVVACAVVLNPERIPSKVADSKSLSADQRQQLADQIFTDSLAVFVAQRDNVHIDRVNILEATFDAMFEAIRGLRQRPDHLLIDGNRFRQHPIPSTTVVRGDASSVSIAAASIVAKVVRDTWMRQEAELMWPTYGFARHVGYGTMAHRNAILTHGPCEIHRRTFLKNILP